MQRVIAVAVGAAILLSGCMRQNQTLPPVAVHLPNGTEGAVVYCRAKAQCYQLASQVCHTSYQILQKDDKPATDFVSPEPFVREDSEYIIQCNTHPDKSVEEASR